MLDQHSLCHPRYQKDHTVSRAHNMVPMQMIDKMMKKVSHQEWQNQFLKVIKLWSIFLHVISQSSHNTWLASMVNNNLMKVLKLSNKTAVCSMKNKVSNNWSKCLVTYSLLMQIPWTVSLTSAQPIWSYKTCSAEHH